jgi:hypothetical protein
MIRYHAPANVQLIEDNAGVFLATNEGGRVKIDRRLLRLWQMADQKTLAEVLAAFRGTRVSAAQVRAGLACLAQASFLEREGYRTQPAPPERIHNGDLVSAIIVSYNSRLWLADCLSSLSVQTYAPVETIVVDNASQDGSAEWVEEHRPDVHLVRLGKTVSLAQALNSGMHLADGMYILLLNPDIRLEPDAIHQMVKTARLDTACAAVAAKLRMLRSPAFLNGLGNLVGAISWGTDIGLGYLDLGQFDGWEEIPSACFAAALIPAWALGEVGLLDEGFPMYYEDSEWCYRARLYGYSVRCAPAAVIYHAYSAYLPSEKTEVLTAYKLRRVTYGRLRFITRINGRGYFLSFLFNYLLEDLLRALGYVIKARLEMAQALRLGWDDYLRSLGELRSQRQVIQSRRKLNDRLLYRLQRKAPVPLIWQGIPQLTWDAVGSIYLPYFLLEQAHEVPEFDSLGQNPERQVEDPRKPGLFKRALQIWETEGAAELLNRLGRDIQWRLMQP